MNINNRKGKRNFGPKARGSLGKLREAWEA
jgi:hypothetical protein